MGLSLKKLLPIAGAALGVYNPALFGMTSAASAAALGSGIGTLLGGGNVREALTNAALGYAGGAAMGPAQAAGAAGTTSQAAQQAQLLTEAGVSGEQLAQAAAMETAPAAVSQEAAKQVAAGTGEGILSKMSLTDKMLLGSMVLPLFEETPDVASAGSQFPKGERAPDYAGTPLAGLYVDEETGIAYNTPEELAEAIANRSDRNRTVRVAKGGYIEGPGTGTSDDIKAKIYQNGVPVQEARLSDGEFVMTKKAVDGAGGAARMYEMMKRYERMA